MRTLILLLVLATLAWAEGGRYACLGYSFQLPLDFTGAEREAGEGYVMYYPDNGPDMTFKVVMDRLPADQASTKAEFFNTTYKANVSRNTWSITGKSRTILGRTVSEAGGPVTYGQTTGRAVAYLVPAPGGDHLFVAVVSVHPSGVTQMESIAASLTSSLQMDR